MPATRTTERLVRIAVSAAEAAGIAVGGVRVEKGGAVTVLALNAVQTVPSRRTRGDTCDEVFGEGSD